MYGSEMFEFTPKDLKVIHKFFFPTFGAKQKAGNDGRLLTNVRPFNGLSD